MSRTKFRAVRPSAKIKQLFMEEKINTEIHSIKAMPSMSIASIVVYLSASGRITRFIINKETI